MYHYSIKIEVMHKTEVYGRKQQWFLKEKGGQNNDFEILMNFDLDSFDESWNDWFLSGHDLASHDKEFFEKGVGQHLAIVGLVIKKIK